MQRACLISFLLVFTLGLISAGFTTHAFGCNSIDHAYETSMQPSGTSGSLGDIGSQQMNDESNAPFKQPIHNPDCDCPAHRIHCCSPLVMLDKIDRPQMLNSEMTRNFFEETYLIKPAPFLDGPFQPPRA